jgi:uncharacterized protein
MNSKSDIDEFLSYKTFAVLGLSRDGKSFSNSVYADLKSKGYKLFPVNPNATEIDGEKCYARLSDLSEKVDGAIFFTKPEVTEKLIEEVAAMGIKRVWLQQGAESEKAVRLCAEKGVNAVYGQCVLMFAQPVSTLHSVHKWFKKLFGGLPR